MKTILSLILLLPSIALAGDLWLGTSLYTKHIDNAYPYNEQNELVNFEYFYTERYFVSAMTFENSYYERTNSIQWGVKEVIGESPFFYSFRVGLMHGYREYYIACEEGDSSCMEKHCEGAELCEPTKMNATFGRTTIAATPSLGYTLHDRVELELVWWGSIVIGIRFKL